MNWRRLLRATGIGLARLALTAIVGFLIIYGMITFITWIAGDPHAAVWLFVDALGALLICGFIYEAWLDL